MNRACLPLICVLTMLPTSCSQMSMRGLFSDYSASQRKMHQALSAGDYIAAENELYQDGPEQSLIHLEKGRLHLLNRQYEASQKAFQVTDKAVKLADQKAIVSLSDTANTIGTALSNDNVRVYQLAPYEKAFLHFYMALNYLQQNALEDALVEIRRANLIQEKSFREHAEGLQQANQSLDKEDVHANIASVLANYPNPAGQLAKTQNAYILYLSALLYEADGDLNNAYIDYKRALAAVPNNPELIQASFRLAQQLGMRTDLAALIQQYGKIAYRPDDSKQKGLVIFVHENGVVPALSSWKTSIPVYDEETVIYNLALPFYKTTGTIRVSQISVDRGKLKQTRLADISAMASYHLQQNLPMIIARQVLRLIAKEQMRRHAVKSGGSPLDLTVQLWNIFTERADTRSWQSLPQAVYTSSQWMEPGEHVLSDGEHAFNFHTRKGRITLVWVARHQQSMVVWSKQLGRIQ